MYKRTCLYYYNPYLMNWNIEITTKIDIDIKSYIKF